MNTQKNTYNDARTPLGPHKIITVANGITLLRIIFTISMVICAKKLRYDFALLFFVFAGISDFFDGFVARMRNEQSLLGSYLDPLADKFLVVSALFLLQESNLIPYWFFMCIVFRELLHIFGGAILSYKYGKTIMIVPTMMSKINTTFLLVLIAIIFWFHLFSMNYPNVLVILCLFNVVFAFLSTLQYGTIFIKKLQVETY